MVVFPAINCSDFECVRARARIARDFGARWIHIDISDGKFTKATSWNNPEELKSLKEDLKGINIEVHLMVQNPQLVTKDWFKAGAQRIIIHLEATTEEAIKRRLGIPEGFGGEIGVAIGSETMAEKLFPLAKEISFIQFLAVPPGWSGQEFDRQTLDKIKFLKKFAPQVTIEVDGGVNPATAKLVKEAGADIVASASYIFGSNNPKSAYEELQKI